MIQMQTMVDVADNSGAKAARCIRVLGSTGRRTAGLGDIVVLAIQKSIAGAADGVRPGRVTRGVIVRVRKNSRRPDGSYVPIRSKCGCARRW